MEWAFDPFTMVEKLHMRRTVWWIMHRPMQAHRIVQIYRTEFYESRSRIWWVMGGYLCCHWQVLKNNNYEFKVHDLQLNRNNQNHNPFIKECDVKVKRIEEVRVHCKETYTIETYCDEIPTSKTVFGEYSALTVWTVRLISLSKNSWSSVSCCLWITWQF